MSRLTRRSGPAGLHDVRAHVVHGTRVVVIGDSKSFNFGGGWSKMGLQRSGVATWGGVFATQGYTLADIQAVHLPRVLSLTGWLKPAACIIDGFTNDIGRASYNFTTSQNTLLAIGRALSDAGIMPILATMPPNTAATFPAEVPRWNAWIRAIGSQRHWPVLDLYSVTAGTATGQWLSGLTGDGTHPNGVGNRVIGTLVASRMASILTGGLAVAPPRAGGDVSNLIATNAQLFGGAATGGIAGNWSGSGTGCVFTVVTGDTTIAGNWQTINRPQAASANAFFQLNPAASTGFSPGDRLAVICVYQTSGFEANTNQSGYISLNVYDGASATIATANPISSTTSDCTVNAIAYDELVVPANAASLRIVAGVNGAATNTAGATLQMAQPAVLNLTQLGLSA